MSDDTNDPRDAAQQEGRYANYFQVGHNASEFVLDFGQYYDENEDARFHTRIVTSPMYAKAFLTTLQESLNQYEETFGAIPRMEE